MHHDFMVRLSTGALVKMSRWYRDKFELRMRTAATSDGHHVRVHRVEIRREVSNVGYVPVFNRLSISAALVFRGRS